MSSQFAVVGTGFGAAHLAWIADCPGAEAVALVYGSDKARATELAARHGVPAVTDRLADVLGDVDAVAVVTPVATHAALVSEALEAGVLVVCDKPLATHAAAAAALADLAASRGTSGVVFFQWRLHEGVRALAERCAGGALGAPQLVGLTFEHDFLAGRRTPWPWRHDRATAGAGALADQGVHLADLCRFLTGAGVSVAGAAAEVAVAERLAPGPGDGVAVATGTEDVAAATLVLDGGGLGLLGVSRAAAGRRRIRVSITGSEATATLEIDPETAAYRLCGPGAGGPGQAGGAWRTPERFNPYDAIAAAGRNASWPVATFADGVAAQRVVDGILDRATQRVSAGRRRDDREDGSA